MLKAKTNIIIGVLTGLLAGFVLGAAFGTPGEKMSTDRKNLTGNVSRIPAFGRHLIQMSDIDSETLSDTTRYEATGDNGENLEIIIIKRK